MTGRRAVGHMSVVTGKVDRWLWAALALGIAAALVPIWVPRFLPLLDFPNHLAEIAIWNRYHDAAWGYQRYYALGFAPVPYWFYYASVHVISFVAPLEVANKIFLSLYAAAVPLSVLAAAVRFGRSPWLSILSLPFIFNYSFAFGFLTCAAGMPLFFFGLVLVDRLLERVTLGRALAVFAITFTLYFTHVFAWLTFGLCAAALVLLNAGAIVNALTAALAMLPSLLFAAWNFRFASKHGLIAAHAPHWVTREQTLDLLIRDLPQRLILRWPGHAAFWLLVLLLITWLVVYATSSVDAPGGRAGLGGLGLELCVVVVTAAYLTVPFTLKKPIECWNVGPRLAPVAVMLILLLPRGSIVGWRRFLLAPALAAALLYPLAMKNSFVRFNRHAAGFVHLMKQVPRGATTLVLPLGDKTDPDVSPDVLPYTEFQAYAQVLSGGYNALLFLGKGFPVNLKPGTWPKTPPWNHPEKFDPERHTTGIDYLLTQNEAGDGRLMHGDYALLLGREGPWRLYKLHVERPDP